MRDRTADILVAGAGPAGATIARLLALRGRRVVLVDPGTRRTDRLEVIAPAACRVVEAVGIAHLLHDTSIGAAVSRHPPPLGHGGRSRSTTSCAVPAAGDT